MSFKQNLVDWFEKNQREMPWRETSNPYYIWLSEVMLQQTQVKTVIDYYYRFIHRFPTISELSKADEDEVLKYWEGLGYYSRARNFHTAIKEVDSNYNGEVPSEPENFGKLKGVGPYTKAAVMSIAFNHSLATVDGNVFRVWSRLNNDDRDTQLQSTRKAFESELEPYVQEQAGTFNQAMMELGALICTPKSPLCLFCPVQENCEAFDKGTVNDLPVKNKKIKKTNVDLKVVLIRDSQGNYLVERREEKLLNGMWQFPMRAFDSAEDELSNQLNYKITTNDEEIYKIKHQFTHKTWNLHVYSVPYDIDLETDVLPDNMMWMNLQDKENYSFSVSMTKIYNFING